MIIIGSFIAILLFIFLTLNYHSIHLSAKLMMLVFIALGLFLIIYDVSSPVKYTKHAIITNYYKLNNSELIFTKPTKIIIYNKYPARKGAIYNYQKAFKIEVIK